MYDQKMKANLGLAKAHLETANFIMKSIEMVHEKRGDQPIGTAGGQELLEFLVVIGQISMVGAHLKQATDRLEKFYQKTEDERPSQTAEELYSEYSKLKTMRLYTEDAIFNASISSLLVEHLPKSFNFAAEASRLSSQKHHIEAGIQLIEQLLSA